jgi:hypothetical protein
MVPDSSPRASKGVLVLAWRLLSHFFARGPAFLGCISFRWVRASAPARCRDENGFGIFRNSKNRFRFFSVGFIGIGIFRNRYRLPEFKFEIGIEIGTAFYRPFLSDTDFNRNFTGFNCRNFRNQSHIPAHTAHDDVGRCESVTE